jgi:hypothetical protein
MFISKIGITDCPLPVTVDLSNFSLRRCSANTPPIVVEPIAEADIENAEYNCRSVSPSHQLYDGAHFGLD